MTGTEPATVLSSAFSYLLFLLRDYKLQEGWDLYPLCPLTQDQWPRIMPCTQERLAEWIWMYESFVFQRPSYVLPAWHSASISPTLGMRTLVFHEEKSSSRSQTLGCGRRLISPSRFKSLRLDPRSSVGFPGQRSSPRRGLEAGRLYICCCWGPPCRDSLPGSGAQTEESRA